MRLAILLGFSLFWAVGAIPTAPDYSARGAHYDVGVPSLFTISAQGVTTSTATLPAQVGPVISSTVATSNLTATPTVAAPPPPTVAVPVVGNDSQLRLNPFDTDFLFNPPRPPMGPFSWACFALMIALLGGSGYIYAVKRPQWKRTNIVLYRAANRWSQPGLWTAILGLLLILFRLVGLDFFNLRFWLYLWFLGLIGLAVWFFMWYRTAYPKELEKFRKTQRARQYMPGGAVKTPARQPDRTVVKPAQQPRAAQKSTTSGATPQPKQSGTKKSGKGK